MTSLGCLTHTGRSESKFTSLGFPWDPSFPLPPPAGSLTWLGQVHRVKQSSSFSPAVGEGSYKCEMSPTTEVVLFVTQSLTHFQFYSKAMSKYWSHGAGGRHLAPANAWALRWLRTQLPTKALTWVEVCVLLGLLGLSPFFCFSQLTQTHTHTHTHTHTAGTWGALGFQAREAGTLC